MRTASRVRPAIGAALCAALLLSPAATAAPSGATVYRSATAGTLAPSAPAALAPQLTAPSHRSHGVRRVLPSPIAPASSIAPPAAAPTPLSLGPASLLANFNGVSSRDSAEVNFGGEFEPPDQGLCSGNGFVLEMVNSAYSVYDTAGKKLAGPFEVNGPFNEGLSEFSSDPRCYYDAAHNTWFATILTIDKEETGSALDIAVNTSGDPRTPWTAYKLNTTGLGGAGGPRERGCPCFGDQPTLGFDAHNIYVSTNEFSIKGPQFDGAQIYAFAKKDLVALSSTVHYVHFAKLAIGGAPAASVQPALTTGSPAAEYFLGSIDPAEKLDQRIGVWALSEPALVAQGGIPTLSSLVLTSEAFGVPPKAEQKGAASLIDTGDDRMQQAQFTGGAVWGELTTALTIPGDPQLRSGAAWFQVRPHLAGNALGSASIVRQGYVAVSGNYVMYPALQATPSGNVAMVLSVSGRMLHPSAAYSLLAGGAGSFGPVTVAAPGTGVYDPEGERWGDYSYALLDPSLSSVWLATEYVPPKSSQTLDGHGNWGTRVLQVSP